VKFSNFEEWEPYYTAILDYFSFDRSKDEEAATVLSTLLKRDDFSLLAALCKNHTVTVCGNGPSLTRDLPQLKGNILAADAATEVVMTRGIRPDVVFTDLDGATEMFEEINREGTIIVVHAHGDNISLIRHWVPKFFGPTVGTTQSKPLPNVHNFGGFTDGDRAVFAAHALGARKVNLIGFDLDDFSVDPVKRGKLMWARRLLELLGYEI